MNCLDLHFKRLYTTLVGVKYKCSHIFKQLALYTRWLHEWLLLKHFKYIFWDMSKIVDISTKKYANCTSRVRSVVTVQVSRVFEQFGPLNHVIWFSSHIKAMHGTNSSQTQMIEYARDLTSLFLVGNKNEGIPHLFARGRWWRDAHAHRAPLLCATLWGLSTNSVYASVNVVSIFMGVSASLDLASPKLDVWKGENTLCTVTILFNSDDW